MLLFRAMSTYPVVVEKRFPRRPKPHGAFGDLSLLTRDA
jgi:hypothetical protein